MRIFTRDRLEIERKPAPNLVPAGTEPGTGWSETYLGGSEEAEADSATQWQSGSRNSVQELAPHAAQRHNAGAGGPGCPLRGFHVDPRLIVDNAVFRVAPDVPARFQVGIFTPDAQYPVTLRLSHGSPTPKIDTKKDMHGFAFRVHADVEHDFLLNTANLGTHTGEETVQLLVAESFGMLVMIPRLISSFTA